jgi:hypothetical protein
MSLTPYVALESRPHQVEEQLQGIPNWLSEDIANFGLDVALDMTVQFTQNFTGSYFFEELQGVCIGLRR